MTPAVEATLEATLALEHVVDALIACQVQTSARAGDATPVERAGLRAAVLQLLNELDPRVRAAAEARCASYLLRTLPVVPFVNVDAFGAVVADALGDYRHGLRQVPVAGVGRFV